MKVYKEMTQEIVDELAKTMGVDQFSLYKYNMYNGWCKERGYYLSLSIDDEGYVSLSVCNLENDNIVREHLGNYWLNEICDELSDVWHAVQKLPRGNMFISVAHCLEYISDEGYLCGGDSIEFVGTEDDEDEIVEVRVYGSSHSLLSSYKIVR